MTKSQLLVKELNMSLNICEMFKRLFKCGNQFGGGSNCLNFGTFSFSGLYKYVIQSVNFPRCFSAKPEVS